MQKKDRKTEAQMNTASMADIAFLLLIFFMITTTIVNDKGITLLLPPEQNDTDIAKVHERNLFKVLINSDDKLLIEDEPRPSLEGLRQEIKNFILNYGERADWSENPEKAVVSIKTNRGTSQGMFIRTLDETKAAYYELYADRAGVTAEEYRALSEHKPDERQLYLKGKEGIPMNISIAEPSN